MASAEVGAPVEQDWGVSNPWPWMLLGAAASGAALVWVSVFADAGPAVRFACLLVGLLAAGAGLWLRFGAPGRAAVDRFSPAARPVVARAVSLACWAVALAATSLLAAGLSGARGIPWEAADLAVMWLLVAPWSALLGRHFGRCAAGRAPASERLDGAALCLFAALVAFVSRWALYLGEGRPEEHDSMRLFLAGAALAGLIASYVAGAADPWRLRLVSALIVFHLGGVAMFCVQHPPGPWSLQQAWARIYRPYMDFMFLSNAYRFYAPEPNAASQLWCRLEYDDPDKPGCLFGHWVYLPELDVRGRPQYPLALQYQRRIAMAEYVARGQAVVPALYVVGPDGRHQMAPHYLKRDDQSPFPQHRDKLGHVQVKSQGIPYHPDPAVQQYQPPDQSARMFLESYARRLCREPHPDHPGLRASAVKIYRVLHRTLRPEEFAAGADPHDWTLYLPYYMGKYAPGGRLLDADDPFLYWLVPIRREDPTNPASRALSYAHQHARGSGEPAPLPPPGKGARPRD